MPRILKLLHYVLALPLCVLGQQATGPDAITFVNGDRISGRIIGTTPRGLIFRGAMVGELTIDWSSIRDVHSENGFSGITGIPGTNPSGTTAPAPVAAAAPAPASVSPPPTPAPQPAQVARAEQPPAPPVVSPAAPAPAPPSAPAPEQPPASSAARHLFPGVRIFSGWQGSAAAGVSYVAATTSVINFTPVVSLMRTWPKGPGAWPVRGRTYVNFLVNFSKQTQNGDVAYFDPISRTVILPGAFLKTYAMHAEFAQDYFLFPRFFVQGGAIFDHNYAQSLDLLQSYGGGLGYVLYRTNRSEFDLRAGVGFSKQQYDGFPRFDTSVIGSRFYQSYEHKFGNGMYFSEQGGMRPAWTDPRYLFGGGQLSFNMPVYHHLNLNVSSFDFWSRTPPPMLKKNIFQVALGVSYAF